mmetsp:Transcript_111884/g.349603  ORF Transcript_111884/g.349603 Transcript_111884/m.349603 type:complete len:294 (-) Transcript_111884:91-972(-)
MTLPAPLVAGVVGLLILITVWWMQPRAWQLANALAFVANVVAVRSIPRLDSGNPMLQPLNYLTPAPYAFAIWGIIYFLEYALVCWQLLPSARTDLLRRVSPWWCGANACQVLWCCTFRPRFDSPGLLWISAVALSGIAACLDRAHALVALRREASGGPILYAPITLHYGWTTAAALVNWNGYAARCTAAAVPKLAVALLSAALAGSLGCSVAVERRSALYGCTVAWALLAVGLQTWWSEPLAAQLGGTVASAAAFLEVGLAAGLVAVAAGIAIGAKPAGNTMAPRDDLAEEMQ